MTPGQYIRAHREERGFTLGHMALQLDSEPAISCRARAELLGQIEDGLVPVNCSAAIAIWRVLRAHGSLIDLETLAEAVDQSRALMPPIIRRAGCAALAERLSLHERDVEAPA